MNKILKILTVLLLAFKVDVFSASSVIDYAHDEIDMNKATKPLALVSSECVQQGMPVTLYCYGHRYFFDCAIAAEQMQKFYAVVRLLSPRNNRNFIHRSVPTSASFDLHKDHTRDGFMLANYSFVMEKMSKGSFEGVLPAIADYIHEQIAPIGSQIFGVDVKICLNKYGFLTALRMHLDGVSLPDIAGFLARANLVYGTDPADIKRWLRNRAELPNATLINTWYDVSLRLRRRLSTDPTSGVGQAIASWIEDGGDPL